MHPYCTKLMLGDKNTASYLKHNADLDCQVLMQATKIRGKGEPACLMTSRKMPKQLENQQ